MLEILNVEKSFGQKTAVKNINLTVNDGEFLSILGPSGCGKTTLLRLIAGLDTPTKGQIKLSGTDITNIEAHERDIHTVFQRYALFPHMNIFDNVAFGLRCQKVNESEIKRRVTEMLELASLKDQGHRRIQTLSGGEQQRVALIRALVNMPKILLLDEPLGALDLSLRLQLQQELMTIQKRVKTTFVFVTHDQQEALNMSDRVAVMNKGEIAHVGTPNEIYEFPKTFFVASFVGGINKMQGTLRQDDANKFWIEIENLGSFAIEPNETCRQNGLKGVLGIRPEKLNVFSRKPTAIDNVIEGNIRAQSYLGTHTQYEIILKNAKVINVFQQNTQKLAKKTFQIGDKIYLGWQISQSHFFAEKCE